MQFWSRGLGKRNLTIDCGTETVDDAGTHLALHGTVRPPLAWQYTITMEPRDWLTFFQTAFHPIVLLYLLRPRRWRIALRAAYWLTAFLLRYVVTLALRPFVRNLGPNSTATAGPG